MNRLKLFQQFAKQIKRSYGAISSNIQEVVEVLNLSEGVDDDLKKHIRQIIASLGSVEQKVFVARKLADDTETLSLLEKEIKKIRNLGSYLKLAEKDPSHSVIVAINSLNNSLMALFDRLPKPKE